MENDVLTQILKELQKNNQHLKKSASLRYAFVRGLIAGFASVIGGTVLVTIVLGILSWMQVFPGIGYIASDFLEFINSSY